MCNHANNGLLPLVAPLWDAVAGGNSRPTANMPVAATPSAAEPGYPPPPPK